jgi:cytochrome c-type biogenesis protein
MTGENISLAVAFTTGVASFLSPCILPLVPSFIAYITGISFSDLKNEHKTEAHAREVHRKTIVHTSIFILGFSLVFILMGLTATAIGSALFQYQKFIRIAGGVLIIFFGLTVSGVLKFAFMEKDHHLNIHAKKATHFGSFLVGVTFAAAWTPCVGPILGSILAIASTKESVGEGAKLLAFYSAGIGVPFMLTALAINTFLKFFNRFKSVMGYVNKAAGWILVLIGVLIVTDKLNVISEWLLVFFSK